MERGYDKSHFPLSEIISLENQITSSQQKPPNYNWLSICQIVLNIIACICMWSIAILILIIGVVELGNPSMNSGRMENKAITNIFLMVAGLGFMGFLQLPSIYFVVRHHMRKAEDVASPLKFNSWAGWILLSSTITFPLVLLSGSHLSTEGISVKLLLPILHIIGIGIPILIFYLIGTWKLPLVSHYRDWGVLTTGMTLSPFLIMIAEIIMLIIFVIIGMVFFVIQPDWQVQLGNLYHQLLSSHPTNQEGLLKIFAPYILNPWILVAIILFAGIIVPLIEEGIKPIGIWLLLSRGITPMEGFQLGLLSGAGYALFESLLLASAPAEWWTVVVARSAASLLHTFNCGLTGWGIALSWGNRRPGAKHKILPFTFSYLIAILFHGTWNTLAVFLVWAELANLSGLKSNFTYLIQLGHLAPFGLIILVFFFLFILVLINHKLRRSFHSAAAANSHANPA